MLPCTKFRIVPAAEARTVAFPRDQASGYKQKEKRAGHRQAAAIAAVKTGPAPCRPRRKEKESILPLLEYCAQPDAVGLNGAERTVGDD